MDLTVFNNLDQLDSEIGKKFNVALDGNTHVAPDRHLIGESLPTPDIFPKELGTAPSFGQSPVPAREDHVHGMTPWSENAATNWYGLEGSNGYLLLGNPEGTHHVYLRTKTNLDSLYLGVNGANTFAINPSGNHSLTGYLAVSGDITSDSMYTDNWFRSTGNTGWHNDTWTAGIHCNGDDWVRTYGGGFGFYSQTGMGAGTPAIASTSGYQALYRNTSVGSFAHFTSSREMKENIEPIGPVGDLIDQFNPVTFYVKAEEDDPEELVIWKASDQQYGFIAEEMAEIDEGQFAIYDGEMKPISWDPHPIVTLLMSEVQELRLRVAALEA